SVDDRQIDTLIGLAKGVTADNEINIAEAEFLQGWLVNAHQASDNPIVCNLLARVDTMLADGALDTDEARELLSLLYQLTGGESEVGEVAKTAMLPVDNPPPSVLFGGRSFVFTGTCAYGTRADCRDAVE